MSTVRTQAEALLRGDRAAAERVAAALLRPHATNFVERPWGGVAIREYKRLCPLPDQRSAGAGLGEAFEVAACDDDEEARAHPSFVTLEDGSTISLPLLLSLHGETILGSEFVARYGACFPLLPKTLDVKELLSVQGHPPGHTEVYVIVAAEPGATIRLGFNEDVDADLLEAELEDGLAAQRALLDALGGDVDQHALQRALGPWLAARGEPPAALVERLGEEGLLDAGGSGPVASVASRAADTKRAYWRMLDRLNTIPVAAGQIVHNTNPERIAAAAGAPASAEVHALGNPEGLEVLALEIRRPGPTFRAWDNVRFPVRPVDVGAAIRSLNLRRTTVEDFLATPVPVSGAEGFARSIDSPYFRVEHLTPRPDLPAAVPGEAPHSLHVLDGSVAVHDAEGRMLGSLERGESAVVPRAVGAYCVAAQGTPAHVVKASVPDPR